MSSSISLNPSIYKKLPYDTLRDLVPVTSVAAAAGFLMVAGPSLPVASVKELIALAKMPESKVNFGSPGYGNSLHLAGEVFKIVARKIVDLENHRDIVSYENALTLKNYYFSFVNSYISCFIMAFWARNVYKLSI